MALASVRTSQLSRSTLDWYARYLASIEARDIDAALGFIHDDCVIQVNDRLPNYGKAAITRALQRYYEAFARVEHEVLNVFGFDSQFSVELLCHYGLAGGGATVTIPAAVMYDRDPEGIFTSMRLYISAGGMFEAFTEAAS